MKRIRVCFLFLGLMSLCPAAPEASSVAPSQVVELPPLMVESRDMRYPWLYGMQEGVEMLARCDGTTARDMLQGTVRIGRALEGILPSGFLGKNELPHAIILYSQALNPQVPQALIQEMKKQVSDTSGGDKLPRIVAMPNLNLPEIDIHCSIAFIREGYSAEDLSFADTFVRLQMLRRTPQLPTWFIEGFCRFYRSVQFNGNTLTLGRLSWGTIPETELLRKDAFAPRNLLTTEQLFASGRRIPVGDESYRRELWLDQLALFVRWAVTGPEMRKRGFWNFVERCCTEMPDEKLLQQCLGLGYRELQDALSDYLPTVLSGSDRKELQIGKIERPHLKEATEPEIVRLKAEWERLQLGFVRQRAKSVAERYEEQVRKTLERLRYDKTVEPRVQATRALLETDLGNLDTAYPLLEKAVACEPPRVKALYELARLRFLQTKATLDRDGATFSREQTAFILEPLKRLRKRMPRIPGAGILEATTWLMSSQRPTSEDLGAIDDYLGLFPKHGGLALLGGRLLAVEGRRAEALRHLQLTCQLCEDAKYLPRLDALGEEVRSGLIPSKNTTDSGD